MPDIIASCSDDDDRLGARKVDGICVHLDAQRPGRVQEILGRTKLRYFGASRVTVHQSIKDREGLRPFLDVWFTLPSVARSAVIVGLDQDHISVSVYKEREVFTASGEQHPVIDILEIHRDGTTRSHRSATEQTAPAPVPRERRGFLGRLFG